ncbi:MAG: hypothetical protein ACYDEY_04690 [Acidimicrobiales bacterium]
MSRRSLRAVRRDTAREGPVGSIPKLRFEAEFTRSARKPLRGACTRQHRRAWPRHPLVSAPPADWPLVFAVDAYMWPRCDAETSPERGSCHSASRHCAGHPIVAGWSYQWVSQFSWANDSWSQPLDAMRLV